MVFYKRVTAPEEKPFNGHTYISLTQKFAECSEDEAEFRKDENGDIIPIESKCRHG
jgi:hypothetical protein